MPWGFDMTMQEEDKEAPIEQEGEAPFVVLEGGLVGLIWVRSGRGMVAIAEEGSEILLRGISIAVGGDAIKEDAVQDRQQGLGEACLAEPGQDGRVITVGSHMGAANPTDEVSSRAIEMEEGGRHHGDPVLVEFCLRGPVFGESP